MTELGKLVENRDTYLSKSLMGGLNKLAGAAVLAAGISAADAQEAPESVVLAAMTENQGATELVLPHPDGPLSVDVSRVALATQVEIMEHLQSCLEEGFDFADENADGKIDAAEVYDLREEGAYCSEEAEMALVEADAKARIDQANARIEGSQLRQAGLTEQIAEADARIAAARQGIADITDGLLEGARAEGG